LKGGEKEWKHEESQNMPSLKAATGGNPSTGDSFKGKKDQQWSHAEAEPPEVQADIWTKSDRNYLGGLEKINQKLHEPALFSETLYTNTKFQKRG